MNKNNPNLLQLLPSSQKVIVLDKEKCDLTINNQTPLRLSIALQLLIKIHAYQIFIEPRKRFN